MPIILSPNMSLPIPSVGLEPGPEYAEDVNDSLTLLDSHDHSPGKGVKISPEGIDINSSLDMGGNDLIGIRSLIFESQVSPLVGPLDLRSIYAVNGDLYYTNDLSGAVQLTSGGSIAAAAGNIANLGVGGSTATFVDITDTFVWESGPGVAGNMDNAAITLRKQTAGSAGITIQPPVSLTADYTITLPTSPPIAPSFLSMDISGNISAGTAVSGGITVAMLAAAVAEALNPAGTILMTGRVAAPAGYLLCDGSAVSKITYAGLYGVIGGYFGELVTTFNVPDMRGRFPRGRDNGSGRDPDAASRTPMNPGALSGDNMGTVQGHAFQSHYHDITNMSNVGDGAAAGGVGFYRSAGTYSTNGAAASGPLSQPSANETRPVNAYVNFMIKT